MPWNHELKHQVQRGRFGEAITNEFDEVVHGALLWDSVDVFGWCSPGVSNSAAEDSRSNTGLDYSVELYAPTGTFRVDDLVRVDGVDYAVVKIGNWDRGPWWAPELSQYLLKEHGERDE